MNDSLEFYGDVFLFRAFGACSEAGVVAVLTCELFAVLWSVHRMHDSSLPTCG